MFKIFQNTLRKRKERKEQEKLLRSLPMNISKLKELLSLLNRESAPACDHSLKETLNFLSVNEINSDRAVKWFNEHGGHCDCEIIYNVYDKVGDIVDWHLDEVEET